MERAAKYFAALFYTISSSIISSLSNTQLFPVVYVVLKYEFKDFSHSFYFTDAKYWL